jgi:hypothetical protein
LESKIAGSACWYPASTAERGAQNDRQIARFLDIEAAGNRSPAAGDSFLNHWRGINPVIENDCQTPANIGAGNLFKQA